MSSGNSNTGGAMSPASGPARLLVVSNRLPARLLATGRHWRSEHSAGGLATAMSPVLEQSKGFWIGWPGSSEGAGDPRRQEVLREWETKHRLIAVELRAETARRFYEGYSNQTLWPLFHYFPSRFRFDANDWAAYRTANENFRDSVVSYYREGDLIWVHDYQLMLLPKLLRDALPHAQIGFFLHIPFPSPEVFRILPNRERLLQGLLGADLIAFQTYSHLQHFRGSLLRVLGLESRIDQVDVGSRAVRLEALPIGIAPDEFAGLLRKREAAAHRNDLQKRYQGRRILLAIDRMDYTKGIPERLRAYRRLLERAPALRGRIVLIQIAVPSRERIVTYEALRRQVNELVGEINGQYATPDWTPVIYIRRGISRAELVALYASADLAWVTPLRDGMNLVCKEYVACQESGEGVLVLSEFAGAAEEMGEAFLVNPHDEESTAAAVESALALSPDERRGRMEALRNRVRRNNVFAWSSRFLEILRQATPPGVPRSGRPAALEIPAILDAYRQATRRVLFLDYDGTLAPYAPKPEDAIPQPELPDLLQRLTNVPGNTVTLVSGRRREDLTSWFGSVSGLWLAAEHGALLRPAGSDAWEPLRPGTSTDWKQRVLPVLQHFADRTPGSFIEEKDFALVWHYRMASEKTGEWLAHELVAMLESMLAETELHAMRGRKTVEVKPLWIHKGSAAERVLATCGSTGFQFAAGDDRTDEDLFEALGSNAWTVHVGVLPSRARFSLPDSGAMIELLKQFT